MKTIKLYELFKQDSEKRKKEKEMKLKAIEDANKILKETDGQPNGGKRLYQISTIRNICEQIIKKK